MAGSQGDTSAGANSGSGNSAESKRAAGGGASSAEPRRSGVLAARATKILPGSGGTQFGLLVVLAAAIVLLGFGALPRQVVPHPATAALLARRRALVAGAGFAALAAFLVSYFVA